MVEAGAASSIDDLIVNSLSGPSTRQGLRPSQEYTRRASMYRDRCSPAPAETQTLTNAAQPVRS